MRFVPVLAAAAAFSIAVAAFAVAQEAAATLLHGENDFQPHARGGCSVRDGTDFQRFSVVAEGIAGDGAFHVWLGDGRETLHDLGAMTARDGGVRVFHRTTQERGELPFGVETVRALAERRVEVRDGEGHVILRGHVPVIREAPAEPPPPPPRDEPVVTRSHMHRTAENGDRAPVGVLVAARRADGSSLRLEVGRLAPESGYLVYLWSEADLVLWDDFRTGREGGGGLTADTARDPGLPLHAASVAALAGRRVEVRDREGHLLLYGEVPAAAEAADEAPVRETRSESSPETGADLHVAVEIRPERGREELRIVVRDIPRESHEPAAKSRRRTVEVRMDDGSGTLEPVARVRVVRGRAQVRWDSRRGRELPFGVESVRDLSGRAVEVFDGAGRVAAGGVPQL